MSSTFNPPPGWPAQPPGWIPPPGWTPDPRWPPPPAGWQFWIPAGAAPAPVAARPRYGRWWALGGGLLALVLLACGIGGGALMLQNRSGQPEASGGGPQPSPPAAAPDAEPEPAPAVPRGLGPGDERTGTGPAVVPLELPSGGLHIVTLTHTGGGLFDARLLDTGGQFSRRLGGGVGDFASTYPLELRAHGAPGAVDIVAADGSWTVQIEEITAAPAWPDQTTGTGPAVLRLDPPASASALTVLVTNQGGTNLFIWGHVAGEVEALVVNEIGDWTGSAALPAGTFVLEIDTDGSWRIEPS